MGLQRFNMTADYTLKYKTHFIHTLMNLMEFGFVFWKNTLYFIMEIIQIWSLDVQSVYVPIWVGGAQTIFNLWCLCAPQNLQSSFPQTIPPTGSISSCSADFITSWPGTKQQTWTFNTQHLPLFCLFVWFFPLMVEMSGFSGKKSKWSGSTFTSTLEYGTSLPLLQFYTPSLHMAFPQTPCHPLRCMMKAEGVWPFVYGHQCSQDSASDVTEGRLKPSGQYSMQTLTVFSICKVTMVYICE